MGKKYKAVAITVPNKNTSDEFVASVNETRYVIKDMESGSIVDDAQGYGYRTAQKAYAGWSYKMSSSRPFSGGITAEGGEKSPSTKQVKGLYYRSIILVSQHKPLNKESLFISIL